MKTKTIPFAEMRRFLQAIGYKEKCTETAQIFHLAKDRLLVFRRYGDNELVDARDIISTRRFLDAWGLLDAADFDAFLEGATTSA